MWEIRKAFATWGEFKAAVESQGITDESLISYIDVSSYVSVVPDTCSAQADHWILE